jgi:uncharacterized membrane protein
VPWADDAVVEAGTGPKRGHWDREERGVEFSRIVAFSDGVFAIAITLLVLQINLPESLPAGENVGDAFWDQQGDLLAYALSFAVIGRLWLVHHRFFGEVTGFDGRLMGLNLVYLGLVVLIPFSSEVLGDYGDTTAGVILYAANLALTNLVGGLMFLYAARSGLATAEFVEYVRSPLRLRNFAGSVVFGLSIVIALLDPLAAMLLWGVLFLIPNRERRG